MTLLDQYLKAVAAQLPKATRDDIVAELRDMILSRFEAKEEALGRPLTDAEQETILREVGHPLAVAGRYHTGANHVIGPELYPYFLFAVKIGLAALVAITLFATVIRILVGEVSFAQGVGHLFSNVFSGAITLIGFAAIAGFIMERMPEKPKFLREWRVQDLHLYELAAFDTEALERTIKEGSGKDGQKGKSMTVTMGIKSSSPAANALGAAMGFTVLLLWWTGVLPIADLRPGAGSLVWDGVDWGAILTSIVETLFWPMLAYLAARIALELFRAWRPNARRAAALGDLTLAAVRLWGVVWIWTVSALAPVIRLESVQDLVDQITRMAHGHWSLATILSISFIFMAFETVSTILKSLWKLVTPAPAAQAA